MGAMLLILTQPGSSLFKLPSEESRQLHNCDLLNSIDAVSTAEKLTTLWKKRDQAFAQLQGKLAQPILSSEVNITFDR